MTCYACSRRGSQRCPRCGKLFCQKHGDELCAACQDPGTAVPSGTVFRGSLLALLVASILALWLLIRPPGLPKEETSQQAALLSPTVTPTALATTPAPPSPTATPTASPTVRPTATITITPTRTASPTAAPSPEATPSPTLSPTPSPTPEAPPFIEYEVQPNDNLSVIANRFGTTVQTLVEINGLESQDVILSIGQKLLVPAPSPTPTEGAGPLSP